MDQYNPYQPPATPVEITAPVIPPFAAGPEGLGGWLLLVGLGIVASPFRMGADIASQYKLFGAGGLWHTLTTPGSADYHPAWAPFIVAETAGNVFFLVFWIVLAILFFRKMRVFPKCYIWAHVSGLVFFFADVGFVKFMRPELPLLDPESTRQLVQGIIGVAIWTPYMLRSTRVAATFVH